MKYIVRAGEAPRQAPLGGKARALAALHRARLPIPPWLVVLPEAFEDSLGPDRLARLHQCRTAAELHAVLADVVVHPLVTKELETALAELSPAGERLAVRSSASDEDGAQHSFAGQLESYLFVPPAEVAARLVDVWRSGFSERIVAYRQEQQLSLTPRPPAVLIQRMIDADVAGVAFGADPVSGRRGLVVLSAVFGLGTALVSGESDADTYHVDRDNRIVQRQIADKQNAHRFAPGSREGVTAVPLPAEKRNQPALSDPQVLAVAELVRATGRHFGRPQDIEWALAAGQLYLLQSRPITALAARPDPDGVLNLWDNSNIAESYNGITTPLTFSFASRAYEEVYRQFCRILGVPEQVISASDDVFRHMLGLIRGTVYYNLLNWYRLLAMLPGFKANRAFMEQMMGVKEPLPASLVAELGQASWIERMRDRLRLVGSLIAIAGQHFTLSRHIRRFYQRLTTALGSTRPDLTRLRPDELTSYYRDLERQLLTRWDAPLVNDFFAMIFYGVLGKLTRTWCGDEQGTLQNDLLCAEGGMISAEPARRVRALATLARQHPVLVDALCEGELVQIEDAIATVPEFAALYRAYLDRFGDRCLEELKLESNTLFDDPLPLLRSIGQFARRPGQETLEAGSIEKEQRRRAEERVREALKGKPFKRGLFHWVLSNARARVRDRENLRFERTRLFGRVRDIVVEMGRRFYALDLLDEPRDIFYLELNEILGFVEGTATCTDLRGLAALRKAEFANFRTMATPGDRFETKGIVHVGHSFTATRAPEPVAAGEERRGLGCCPGVVRGPVRVIREPKNATLKSGDILVAERTDPGWIMLFPAAAGLLVERGSLLSHSAIVAREMGLPAIVALNDVTRWLHDGELIEMDGSTGVVRRLQSTKEAAHGE